MSLRPISSDSGIQDLVWLQAQQDDAQELANVTHIHAHRGRAPRPATPIAIDLEDAALSLSEQQQQLQ